jgi:hypothetical protein
MVRMDFARIEAALADLGCSYDARREQIRDSRGKRVKYRKILDLVAGLTLDGQADYNCIFVGSKGYLGTNGRGEGVGLLPGERWAEYKLPEPFLSRPPGASTGSNHAAHGRDWIRACKGGAPACSNFGNAGPYTEWLVLGAIAVRVPGPLKWDAANLRFTNSQEATNLVKPAFRKGWEISLS